MKSVIRCIYILLFASVILTVAGCHEKGCTDPNAINYNAVADEDDGSCITCQEETDTLGSQFVDLYDNNFSSPHYQDNVARFEIIQIKNKYQYSECGNNECYFVVRIESLVSSRMTFTFNLQANGNIFFNYNRNVIVQANETMSPPNVPATSISNPCGFMTSTSFFVSVNGNIIYN